MATGTPGDLQGAGPARLYLQGVFPPVGEAGGSRFPTAYP